jgi:hypothetical protein
MAERCCYNKILMKVSSGEEKMKTREDKRMVKLDFLFSFKIEFFGHLLKKISTFIFFGARSFLLVHI